MAESLVPPGYVAQELGRYSSIDDMKAIEHVEASQAEGTRMVVQLNFGWRFPFFKELSGAFNWVLEHSGVKPWPEYGNVVFYDKSNPVWYIAWYKGAPFWQVILAGLVGFFSSTVGIALVGVFLGSLLYRIIPKEIRQPIEDTLNMLPSLLMIGGMMLMIQLIPNLTRGLSPPK